MRDVLTFTIDPIDARDFDDAISIRSRRQRSARDRRPYRRCELLSSCRTPRWTRKHMSAPPPSTCRTASTPCSRNGSPTNFARCARMRTSSRSRPFSDDAKRRDQTPLDRPDRHPLQPPIYLRRGAGDHRPADGACIRRRSPRSTTWPSASAATGLKKAPSISPPRKYGSSWIRKESRSASWSRKTRNRIS